MGRMRSRLRRSGSKRGVEQSDEGATRGPAASFIAEESTNLSSCFALRNKFRFPIVPRRSPGRVRGSPAVAPWLQSGARLPAILTPSQRCDEGARRSARDPNHASKPLNASPRTHLARSRLRRPLSTRPTADEPPSRCHARLSPKVDYVRVSPHRHPGARQRAPTLVHLLRYFA